MAPLNESNRERVSEKDPFSAVNQLNIRIGAASKLTLCETTRRSEGRLRDNPAVRDERHEGTQHAA